MSDEDRYGLVIYWIFALVFCVSVVGYTLYREGTIFPPVRPTNLEELATWDEPDLWRLMEYYDCNSRPSGYNVPEDLREFVKFCNTVSDYWNKAYKESKYDDAREGARQLRQE